MGADTSLAATRGSESRGATARAFNGTRFTSDSEMGGSVLDCNSVPLLSISDLAQFASLSASIHRLPIHESTYTRSRSQKPAYNQKTETFAVEWCSVQGKWFLACSRHA